MKRKYGKAQSIRAASRDIQAKFMPSMKILAEHVYKTRKDLPSEVRGFELPAGTIKDPHGRTYQIQIKAVRNTFIKKDEVGLVYNKTSILFRLRVWTVNIINKIME